MKKSAYPKSNGKPWDITRRKKFDRFRKVFRYQIAEAAENSGVFLRSNVLTVAAWNCAFTAVTEP